MSGSPAGPSREPGAVRRFLGRTAPGFMPVDVDRWGWLVPAVFLAVVGAVGCLGDPSDDIENWLLMVPLLAAALCAPWVTAVFGGFVLVVNRLFTMVQPGSNPRVENLVLEVCVVLLAVLVALLRSRARSYVLRLQNAVLAAREVVVRPVPHGWGGVESATAYLPADTESRMGGDFFDVLSTPHGARIVLGDVQGKGLAALSTAGAVVGAFREAGYHEPDMSVVAARMEDGLRRHNTLLAAVDARHEPRLVTAVVIAFIEEDGAHADVINFGHEGPLVLGHRGVRRMPQEENLPLGLADLTGARRARISRVPLERSETVLLVTDGVTEARDRHGDFFPLTPWARHFLTTGGDWDVQPDLLLDRLMAALADHTAGHLKDDATLLAVRRTAVGPP
ncbi:PP2C family protein-serine/threonine phosphatase [Streptomyces sp. NPDC098077]|uniref:PP2C family protein-serine/threonine phosphatase n=1 Tax=Streptomyces sp. NPDC098077 TaxID=3366093 RepID=UPI0038156719